MLGHLAFSLVLNLILLFKPDYIINVIYFAPVILSIFHHSKIKYITLEIFIFLFIITENQNLLYHTILSFLSGYIYDTFFYPGVKIKNYYVFLLSRRIRLRKNTIAEAAIIILLLGIFTRVLLFTYTYDYLEYKYLQNKNKKIVGIFCYKDCYLGFLEKFWYDQFCIVDLDDKEYCFNRYNLTKYEIIGISRN